MLDPAVDDVRARHAILDGVERRADLGQHAAVDRAVGEERIDAARGKPGQQRAVLVEHADGVRHQHELFRAQRLGELAGDQVRVDVVGDAVGAHADGRDHRDEITRVQELDELGIDALDLADESDVDRFGVGCVALQQHLPRMNERAVLSGEPDRLAAVLVDEADDLLIELAQDHLDDVHHALVGDAHALAELALDAHLLQEVADLRTAAVDDDGVHADELQHHDVAREARLQLRLDHRVAAVLDDDRLVVEALDVGQRLGKDLRLHGGIDGVDRHGGDGDGAGRKARDRLYRKRRPALSERRNTPPRGRRGASKP